MTPEGTWETWADRETERIRGAGQWRAPRDLDAAGPEGKLAPDGRAVIAFASNDYLGLTQHPAVIAAAHAALDRWGAGSGAARLIVGSRPVHSELESELAAWKRSESAVLFPTGFAANLGVLTCFAGPNTLICSDELNHASIIDGARLAHGPVEVFPHRDLDALARLLGERDSGQRALVVTDTVFSMDGDLADLEPLIELCRLHDALLVIDEAHAVLGPDPDLDGIAALRVGTLSKTLGSLGGFVAGPARLTDLLVNRARSYIFTTASTPADAAAALAAVQVVRVARGRRAARASAGEHRGAPARSSVADRADRVRLRDAGARSGGRAPDAWHPRPRDPAAHSRARDEPAARRALGRPHDRTGPPAARRARAPAPRVIFVTGTGTEVGKTWFATRTIEELRRTGVSVAARKPAQSFAPDELGHTDAELLGAASGEPAETVCPRHRWYPVPMAPPMAAAVLGLPPFGIADLATEIAPAPSGALVIVEGAGGPRSPIAADGDGVDLARALAVETVVLVADAGLGTINAVRLCADALRGFQLVVTLNRFDPADDLHARNHAWLLDAGFELVTDPATLAARLQPSAGAR